LEQKYEKYYQNEIKKVFSDFSVNYLLKGLGFVGAFLLQIIVVRIVGVEILGNFAIVTSIISILMMISCLGLDQSFVKYIASSRVNKNRKIVFEEVLYFYFYVLIITLALLLVLISLRNFIAITWFKNSELSNLILYLSPLIFLGAFSTLLGGISRGIEIIKIYSFCNDFLGKVLNGGIFLICFLFLKNKVFSLLISRILKPIITNFILLFHIFKYIKNNKITLKFQFRKLLEFTNIRKQMLIFGLKAQSISIMTIFLGNINNLMLGYFSNSSFVGIFTILMSITTMITFFLHSFGTTFMPKISRLHSGKNFDVLKELYFQINRWLLIFSFPLFLFIFFNSKQLLLLYGSTVLVGETGLKILIIGQFFNTITGVNGNLLFMSDNEKIVLISTAVSLATVIFLNWLLIPKYNIIGTSIAVAISIIIKNTIMTIQVKRIFGIWPYNSRIFNTLKCFTFSIITILLLNNFITISSLFWVELIFKILIYYGIFFFFILTMNFTKDDKYVLKSLISQIAVYGSRKL